MRILITLTFLLFFCSCTTLTFDGNSQKSITVKMGQKCRINFAEDHSTGFTWQLSDDYDKTIIDHYNTVWEGKSKGVYFYFKTLKEGKIDLTFTSRKYTDINFQKTLRINITK